MKLILTRHGETHENRTRKVQGHTFGTLNAFGKAQAKKLARRLANEKIDVIYVSDLERARHTADEIIKHHSFVPVFYTQELRERCMGSWEGESWDDMGVDLQNIDTAMFPEDAENDFALYARGKNFLNKLLRRHMGESVLVIAHGAINGMMLNAIRGVDPSELRHMEIMKNAAVSIFEFIDNKNHVVHVHNCTQHLEKKTRKTVKIVTITNKEKLF